MVDELLDPRNRGGLPKVPSDDQSIALHAQKPGSPKRRFSIEPVEAFLIEAQPVGAIGFLCFRKWLIFLGNRLFGMLIPRANHLAYVAAEDPWTQGGTHGLRDWTSMLDGPVADASICVEHIRRGEGTGRTCVQTRRAHPAMVLCRRDLLTCDVGLGKDRTKEKIASDLSIQKHGIFPDPAEPGSVRVMPLQKWGRVDHGARQAFWKHGMKLPNQRFELSANPDVIVLGGRCVGSKSRFGRPR